MGKATPRLVKIRTRKLLEKFPDSFGTDFEKNKLKIHELELPFSKGHLNLIAGYITRLKKKELVSAT